MNSDPTSVLGMLVMVIGFIVVAIMASNSGNHRDSGRKVQGLTSDESRARKRRQYYRRRFGGQGADCIEHGWKCWGESYALVKEMHHVWDAYTNNPQFKTMVMEHIYRNQRIPTEEDMSGIIITNDPTGEKLEDLKESIRAIAKLVIDHRTL